jgi:hypothetical protein
MVSLNHHFCGGTGSGILASVVKEFGETNPNPFGLFKLSQNREGSP